MAFDEKKFNELLNKKVTNFGGFNEQKFQQELSKKLGTPTATSVSNKDIKTSDGLYNLAVQNGLQGRADAILAAQKGEETKKIFSGGFISDIFDGLNALQYGVTGVLKGKSFVEGVKTRQSFSDKDALGDKGLPGVIAGIALDIAVDPLTYIAPWTIAKKIPGIAKGAKALQAATFGKKVTKVIDTSSDISKGLTNSQIVKKFVRNIPKPGSTEVIIEATGKWKIPGLRQVFDEAMESKNIELVRKLLPDVPLEYKERFSKKIGDILSIQKTYEAVEGGTKVGKYLAQKFQWMAGADPIFKESFERGLKNTAVSTDNIVKMTKGISKLKPEIAKQLLTKDETGRFMRVGLDSLKKTLSPEDFETVAQVYNKIDNLGKEAVDLGLLSKTKYEQGIGEYIKNAYTEFELAKKGGIFGSSKVGIKKMFARSKDLTPEGMAKLGQIDNPAYLLFKSAFDLSKNVENAKMFKTVAEKFGTDVAQEGFTKLPEGIRLGALAGKHVPAHMAEYLKEIIAPSANTIQKQLVANFKFFKVVMNPGTHARNIISNKILNYWKLGMNPLDPRVIKSDLTAVKEIAKGAGKWTDEARPLGYSLDTFASAEMKGLLESAEATKWGKTVGLWGKTKKVLGDMYQAEENHAKLSAYIFQRTVKNLDPETAWKAAESATFNYAQVTPFVRKLRESLFGFPFITFTVKSTPVVAETLIKNPNRISVIGKIKQGIENLSDIKETDEERKNEPAWVKDGFYIKLPIKDKQGRSAYFDLTYILPFGDLMAGNFFERGQDMQTGLPESQVSSAMKKSPFFQVVTAIGKNQDFYGNSIWKNSDSSSKQLLDLMNYLTKSYAPPLIGDQLPGGYNDKGVRQNKGIINSLGADAGNQRRNLMEELMRNVGAKIQPIDADIQDTYTEYNKKKALQNLLRENGILNELNINYVPKNTQ
jgi:hypothetical protein